MEYGIIYKIENKINGKVYIGQTCQPLCKRIAQHKRDAYRSKCFIHAAIRKYGFNNFSIRKIDSAADGVELDDKERTYIEYYGSFGHGYNMNEGGNGVSYIMKERNRQAHFGKVTTKDTRQKMSLSHKNRYSKEPLLKARLSTALIAVWDGNDQRRAKTSQEHSGSNNFHYGKRGADSVNAKAHIIVTPDGRRIKTDCLKTFCDTWAEHILNPKNMNMVAKGKRNHHHGYKCYHFTFSERATTILNRSTPEQVETVGISPGDYDIVWTA